MSTIIRAAKRLDLQDVLTLERSIPELPHWSPGEWERYVTGSASALDGVVLVAEEAKVLVGFAAAAINSSMGRTAELESIAVLPGRRGCGIGRELCRGVIDWSRERHTNALELEVRSRSEAAIALYRSLGFRAVRTRSRYYANPPDDALLMSLTL